MGNEGVLQRVRMDRQLTVRGSEVTRQRFHECEYHSCHHIGTMWFFGDSCTVTNSLTALRLRSSTSLIFPLGEGQTYG